MSRTLSSVYDGGDSVSESSVYDEPWPVRLAKFSIQWTARLINSSGSNPESSNYNTVIAEGLIHPAS